MQKFLRTLTLLALMLVPWVTQGQTVLFSEDFEGGTMPTGWTTDGPGTWSVATGDYSSSTGAGQGTYNAKITHSSTGSSTKLITPAIDFTGISSAVLNYMHIQRSWAGDIDEMRVYYRTDTTGTWTLLDGQEFTSAVTSWTTESDIVLPNLSSTYQIAFEYTDNYGYGIGIDNVIIEQGASCVKPTSLAATLTPGNGTIATLNWTAGGSETAWVLEYSTASDFTGATSVNVTGTPTANLTGLTAEATYYARVKAVCSANDQSGWCNTVCTFTPTNAYSITINDGTATNGYVPIYGYYVDGSIKSTFIIPAADLAAMQYGNITKLTFYASNASVNWGNAQFTVYMTETGDNTVSGIADFTSMEQVMTAGSLGISNNIMEVTLTSPYQYLGGNLMIAFDEPTSGSYVSCSWYGVSATGASYGGYGTSVSQQNFLPKIRFEYLPGQAPTCAKPTQLAVNYTGGTSATLSWTSDATMWNINVNGTVTYGLTANPTTLTGLDLATTYNIMLQANCGNDTSEWTNPVSFTTDLCMPENQCAVTLALSDSYGDGWNGGQLAVVDVATQTTLGTYTLDDGGADTFMVNVCDGRTIDFVYTQGSYPTENGWSITDINEEVIAEHEGCSSGCQVASGSLATYTVGCTVTNCRRPADLAATEIANHSITLSWTEGGEATSWMLAYAVAGDTSFTQVAAATNPFTLTGLLAETAYTVKVRPVCSDELVKWSDAIVVTTAVACPAPSILAVNAGPVTAEISWTGNADNYTLQYAQLTDATNPLWLSYGDSAFTTSVGNSSSQNWTWAVMYPSSMLLPGMVTKVSVYETANYYTSDYTVSIYSGSTTEPTTLLASQTVTPSGVDGFHEITLANPALVEASQNLWVVMNVYGSYVLSACNSTEPNNQWVYSDGWYNIGNLATSLASYGWMINAEITPIDLSNIAWTTVSNATSPTTITGLTIETEYIARVKAICGGQDGESLWSNVVFSTSESNPIPTNVEVVPGASTADFSWTGYSDSYKVYYRIPAQEVITFSEDFEEAIDTNSWAIYTVGEGPQAYGWYTIDPTSGLSFNAQSGSMAASAWSWNNTAYNADNWLVTPQVTLNGTLRYWERTNNGYPDRYEVIVSTTGNTITDFANGTTIRAYDYALNNSQWNEVDIDLSAFNGQLGYIAFHHADTDANYLLIDNLAIVSDTVPAGAWVEVATTTANVTVTGLTPETTYEYRITGIYNNVENNGTEIATFTTDTLTPCDMPEITIGNYLNRNASFSWTCPGDSVFVTLVNNDGQQVWGQFFGPNETSITDMYFPEEQYPYGLVYIYALTVCGDMADSNFSQWAYDAIAVTCDTTDQCTVTFVMNGQNGWQGGALDVYDTVSGLIVSSMTLPSGNDNDTVTYQLCTDRVYRVAFRDATSTGQGSFSNVSFEILGPNGETYFSATAPDTGTIGYFYHTCTAPNNIATLPYFADFENGNDGWTFVNASTNKWYVGSATNNGGSQALYISNDEGVSNAYTVSGTQWSYATRTIAVSEAGNYIFNFDWKANGESNYDFIRAFLAPAGVDTILTSTASPTGTTSASGYTTTVPEGWIDLNPAGGKLNLSTNWSNCYSELNLAAGNYTVVMMWVNDNSGGSQPPAAIDNVNIRLNTCPRVQNVVAIPTDNSINLTWSAGGSETSWEVTCGQTSTVVSTPAYTFTDLMASTDYTISITALCSEEESSAAHTETVHTTCVPVQVPYSENFDGLTTSTTAATGVHVDCWPYIMTGTSTYQGTTYQPQVYYSATYANSGSYSLRLYGVSYTSLPPMAEPLSSLQLSCNVYTTSASYKLAVGVMEGNNFVPVDTIDFATSTHTPVTVYFDSYTGNSRVIAFRNFNTSATSYTSYIYIDDVVVDFIPNCVPVTELAVSTVTDNSITLTWTDNMNDGATYTVSDSASVIASGITGTTYTVGNLASNTEYIFTVTANCSATDESDAVSASGHTLCSPVAVPYSENFDGLTTSTTAATGVHVDCWNYTMTGTSTYQGTTYQPQVYYNSTNANSGSYSLRLYGVSYTCLPQMAEPLSGLQLSFNVYTSAASYKLAVGVMEGDTFVPIDTINTATSTHTPVTVYFSGYNGNSRTIAFCNFNTSATTYYSYQYIDDVVVDYLPNCVPVTNLTAVPDVNSVTLNWDDLLNGDGVTYSVSYVTGVTIATGITGTTYTATDLSPNTDYTFFITAHCSETASGDAVSVSTHTLCGAMTLPYTETFDIYSTTATSSSAPAGYPNITMPDCWTFVNMSESSSSYPQAFLSAYSSYAVSGNCLFFKSSSTTQLYAILPVFETPTANQEITFSYRNEGTSASNGTISVGMMGSDNVFVPIESVERTTTVTEHTTLLPADLFANGARIAFCYTGGTSNNYYAAIDNVDVHAAPSCVPVAEFAASDVTTNSITLTWSDVLNNGATYTIYNVDDSSVVATGITGSTYTVTGLPANTPYNFGIVANCSADDASSMVSLQTRTACAVLTAADLPYTEDFEAYGSGSTATIDPCWTKGTNSTTAYPYPSNSVVNGTRCLYFYGNKPSSATGTSIYSYAALPQLDASVDVSELTVNFNAKRYSSTTATYRSLIYVGVMTDPTDISTFVGLGEVNMTPLPASTIENYSISLANYAGNGKYVAFVCPAVDTTGVSYNYIYIDDVLLDFTPTCAAVSNLTATDITANTVTLTWVDEDNNGATYTVYDGENVLATGITGNTYTATGLTQNTEYNFGVVANCSADDASWMMTVAAHTSCGVEQLPFYEDFSATLANDPCWRGASGVTAAEVFAGTALTLGNPTNWTYTSSVRDGLPAGHYYKNIYGSSATQKCWMITPAIDLTNVTSAQLSFDVALTDYSNAALPDANGDTNTSQAFMVLVSTDAGQTWSANNATVWQNVEEADYTFASLASTTYQNKVIDLTSYVGNTIKIAFYTQSLWSGGDNDLHIDNIAVTEGQSDTTVVTEVLTLNMSINDSTMGSIVPAPGIYTYEEGDTFTFTATPNDGYQFEGWYVDYSDFGMGLIPIDTARTYSHTVTADEMGYELDVIATFALSSGDTSVVTEGLSLALAVNDTTMGTTVPAPGTHVFAVGDTLSFDVIAYEGYHFESAIYSVSMMGQTMMEDTVTDLSEMAMFNNTVVESYMTSISASVLVNFAADSTGDTTIVDPCLVTLPYTEDFEGADLGCWTNDGPGTWTIATGDYSTSTGSYSGSTNAKITHGTTGNATKLISPAISGAETGVMLSFAHIERSWAGDIDELRVYSRASENAAWQMVAEYTNEFATWTLENITISGTVYQVAFEMTDSYGYGVGIDAVNIVAMSSDFCFAPTNITVSDLTATSATLTWSGEADNYQVVVSDGTTNVYNNVVADSTVAITGLTAETNYNVTVRAICGVGDTSMVATSNFFTGYCMPNPTSVDNSGITSVSFGGMTNTTSHAGSTPAYVNNSAMAGSVPAGTTATLDITYATGYTYGTVVWVDWDNSMTFDGNEVVAVGTSTNSNPTTLSLTFDIPATQALGNYRMRILGADSYFDSYTSSIAAAANANPCGTYSYGVAEDYTLTVTEAPACLAPNGLTATPASFSVVLAWNDLNDGGATYSVYMVDSTGNSLVASGITGNNYTVTGLNAETAYTFGVQANCSATETSDMVTVSTTTLVSCPAPTALTATLTSGVSTEATLSWTVNGEETAWQICLNNDTSNLIDVTTNPYTLTNLTAEQTYTAKVRAYCDATDQSTWSNTVTFEPTAKLVIGDGTATNSYLPTNCYYNYSLTQQIYTAAELGDAGLIESIDFYNTSSNDRTRTLDVYVVSTPKTSFADGYDWIPVTAADLQYTGSVTFNANSWSTINLSGFVYDGQSNIAVIVDDNTGSYSSTTNFKVFSADSMALRVYSDGTNYDASAPASYSGTVQNVKNQIRLVKSDLTGCVKPTGVTVDYNGGTTAIVSWNSDANAFNLNINGTVTYNVNNPDTITGLDLATTYSIMVQANCGYDTSEWTTPVSFTTDACAAENQCVVSIYAQDSWGDGWSGNTINIIQNGTTVATYSMASQSVSQTTIYDTLQVNVCAGSPVSFSWTSGGDYSYPDEISFSIVDANGVAIYNVYDASDLTSGSVFFTDTNICATHVVVIDTLTVVVATADSTMGTTNPVPGTYYYFAGDTVNLQAIPNNGYIFSGWAMAAGTEVDTLGSNYISLSFLANNFMAYGSVSFTALFEAEPTCDPITVYPYTQDFTEAPECWNIIDADGDGYNWELIAGAVHSSSYVNNVGPLTPDNWLVTPQFQLATGTNYEVTWNANPQDTSWPAEHYGLYVSTTTADTAAFTLLQEWTLTAAGNVPVVNLSAYAGQTIYLAFRHWNCTDMYRIAIDNFQVREAAGANQITVTLTQNNPMYGSVSGGGVYTIGDSVTVTAVPASNYQFVNWVDGTGASVSTANPYTFVAATDVTLQAIFAEDNSNADSIAVTYTVNDTTMGTITPSGIQYVHVGDHVVATATPATGYQLTAWMLDTYVAGDYYGTDTIIVPADSVSEYNPIDLGALPQTYADFGATLTVTAVFAPIAVVNDSLTLVLAVNDATMGTITPAPGIYRYGYGDTVTLTATPNNGYHLESIHAIVSMNIMGQTITLVDTTMAVPVLTITEVVDSMMLGAVMNLTANFAADTTPVETYYTVTLSSNNDEFGSVSPAGTTQVLAGTQFTATATSNAGYHFIAWMSGNAALSVDSVYTFEVTQDMNLVARFEEVGVQPNYFTVTGLSNDTTMGTVLGSGYYEEGTTATLTAVAKTGYRFVSWSTGETTATITITVTEDVTVTAYFEVDPNSIEDADMNDVTIYSTDSKIIVRGAEGQNVYVFDINGRMMDRQMNAADAIEFRMANTGVYLVKVGTASAKRVLVVR